MHCRNYNKLRCKKYNILHGIIWLGSIAALSPAHAINIEFDYTYDTRGFFTDQITGAPITERRQLLETAASYYSGFTDDLAPIAPQPGDTWSVSFGHPSFAGPAVTLTDLSVPEDTIRVYVGGSSSAPGVLGAAGIGYNLTATGSSQFVDAVLTRNQSNATGAHAQDYGIWGGSIWFNANNDWYFGKDSSGLTPGHPDFLTTATHELGHILGFGEADSWHSQIDDASGTFLGASSVAAYGSPVPLDQYHMHWAHGTASTLDGVLQNTMMDPSTVKGQRELPTVLDYAGFRDIGWQVSPVPEPGEWAMLLAGLGLIAFATRPRRAPTREMISRQNITAPILC